MHLHSATSSQIAVKRKTKALRGWFIFFNIIYLFSPKSKCIAGWLFHSSNVSLYTSCWFMYSLFILALVLATLILIRFLYSCCRKYIKYLSLANFSPFYLFILNKLYIVIFSITSYVISLFCIFFINYKKWARINFITTYFAIFIFHINSITQNSYKVNHSLHNRG